MAEIIVRSAVGLPERAYLSIRVGETRRQQAWKAGSRFAFDTKGSGPPRQFTVDVLEKLGTAQVSLADLCPLSGGGRSGDVQVLRTDGSVMRLSIGVAKVANREPSLPTGRAERVDNCKEYLERNAVHETLQAMVRELLSQRPENAMDFMSKYLQDKASASVYAPPARDEPGLCPEAMSFADIPGLGSDDYPGFPTDMCPAEMPDLSRHANMMAEVLKSDPSIYLELSNAKTKSGVTFAKCVKPGFDTKGHPMIKTVGAVSGDASCFEDFARLFDPIIAKMHPAFIAAGRHITDLDAAKVSSAVVDPTGRHAKGVTLHLRRNLTGLRTPSACSRPERREAERIITRAFRGLGGELRGEYFPLAGSQSCAWRPSGMLVAEQQKLGAGGLFFGEPDAALLLSMGVGRDWPEARGIFATESTELPLAAWVNEEDHLRLMVSEQGADVRGAFAKLLRSETQLRRAIQGDGFDFAWSPRLGYLSSCTGNIGTALRVAVTLSLPQTSMLPGFKAFCRKLRLQVRGATPGSVLGMAKVEGVDVGSLWEISNMERLGSSEVEQVNCVLGAARLLCGTEARLERGEQVSLDTLLSSSGVVA